jgi:hypothetical protein
MGSVGVSGCGSRRDDGVCALASVSKVSLFIYLYVLACTYQWRWGVSSMSLLIQGRYAAWMLDSHER